MNEADYWGVGFLVLVIGGIGFGGMGWVFYAAWMEAGVVGVGVIIGISIAMCIGVVIAYYAFWYIPLWLGKGLYWLHSKV